jgi:hypothetical protein
VRTAGVHGGAAGEFRGGFDSGDIYIYIYIEVALIVGDNRHSKPGTMKTPRYWALMCIDVSGCRKQRARTVAAKMKTLNFTTHILQYMGGKVPCVR